MAQAVAGAAGPSQPERTDAGAVRALVDVIKREEVAVVVNLAARIKVPFGILALTCYASRSYGILQEMKMDGLPCWCYPEAEPSNKLASARAKDIKQRVEKPFPMVNVADFCPTSMEVSRVSPDHAPLLMMTRVNALCEDTPASFDDGEAASEGERKNKKRLDMVRWVAAFQCYALAADAAEVCRHTGRRHDLFSLAFLSDRCGRLRRQRLTCAHASR